MAKKMKKGYSLGKTTKNSTRDCYMAEVLGKDGEALYLSVGDSKKVATQLATALVGLLSQK